MAAQTTRMSTKGQVVIPEGIREEMGLREGTTFIVIPNPETHAILLKEVERVDPVKEFEAMARFGRAHAKKHKLDTSIRHIVDVQHKGRRSK